MTDEQTRIRGYLTTQGAKLAPAEIVDKVRAAMDQLHAAANAVPDARFGDQPAAEEWSANEVMAHVVTAGRHFGGAIVRLLDRQPGGRRARSARARRAAAERVRLVGQPGGGPRRALRARAIRRPASGPRRAQSSTPSSARSIGARPCCSCACTTSTTLVSCRRSPPRWPWSIRHNARRHRPPAGSQRGLGGGLRLRHRGGAARRRLRLVARVVGARCRHASGLHGRPHLAHPARLGDYAGGDPHAGPDRHDGA